MVNAIDTSNNSSISVLDSFTDCKDKTSYTFSKDFNTSNYGKPGKKYFYKITVIDKLNEQCVVDSYTALWNTVPTMNTPSATTSAPYYTKDSNNLVFNSNTKDVIIASQTTNAGAPLVNTVVTLVKVSATKGEMTSPVTYTMSNSEANSYKLNKTLSFKTIPNQGSVWYFTVTSTDKLGEKVTKNSNNFIYNTIPSFSATPTVSTSDANKFIYKDGKSGNIIVNSATTELVVSGAKINTSGAPLKSIIITPVKSVGDGACSAKTITLNQDSYDLNTNKQTMSFSKKPASDSTWYFTLKAIDYLDQSIEINSFTALWNTAPSLTTPIPYASSTSDYISDYSNKNDIIVKSTLKSINLRTSIQSTGAKIKTIVTSHNIVSGDSTQTSAATKKISSNSLTYEVAMQLTAKQASVHTYTITVTDELNETISATSYKVTVNTIPVIGEIFINDKKENHFILSNQKTVKVSGTTVNKGADVKSYLYKNNATGTGASAVANILEETKSLTFNKTIEIKNVSDTKHTFTVTVTDDLNESSSKTTAVATVNTKPYYKLTDKVYINNNNTDDPFLVAHNIGNVNVSWIAPTNKGADITNYYYAYTTDGGKTWSNYIDKGRNLKESFNYKAAQDLSHIFKVYAIDAMGERTDLMYDGTFSNYTSNTLLNNTIPWFITGSTVSVSSSVPCVYTNTVKPLAANTLTNESITIPSTGANINISWPFASNKGGAMTNYLIYRSAESDDKQNYPSKVTYTVASSLNSVIDSYFTGSVTTAYHYYRILPTDIFYGSNTLVDYKNYLYSPIIVKNIKPTFETGSLKVYESNQNNIISSEINSITISYPKMATKHHGLKLQEYQVYISDNDGLSWTKHTTTDTTYTFTDLKLKEDTTYKFKVVIYDGLEYSNELVSDSYLINTIPYFNPSDYVTVNGFREDFDLDYSMPSVTLEWSPATTKGEKVIGYRIEVQRGNLTRTETLTFKEEVNTNSTSTTYVFPLPYTEKTEFDTLVFRIYAYDSYSDSKTKDSYLQSCKLTIKGAFQIKRHD